MTKILTIAAREYRAMVGTKAFIISIIMMPVLMSAGIVAMELLKDVGQTTIRKLAIVDHSGECFEALQAAADSQRNSFAGESKTGHRSSLPAQTEIPGMPQECYDLVAIDAVEIDDQQRFKLSQQVRNQALYAFVEIPANILDTDSSDPSQVTFYSEDSSISLARHWIADNLTRIARSRRFAAAGLDPAEIARFQELNRPIIVSGRGLMVEDADGNISSSEARNLMTTLFMPMGIMMLMFMVIFMASQPMLESVLEEKSQRIAEVLLGSASPFQLMMGKLLGTVAGSLTIFAIYLLGVYAIAAYRDWTPNIPFEIVPWFLVFQITGVLFYAAIFMSVGASVSQLKEAQSMLLPVWMLLMTPLFVWFMIVRDPQSAMAMSLSFFPPTAPTTMVLRLATGQTIALWQPIVSLIVTLLATVVIVVLAGRIFRVGILWQGKTPRLAEILKWAVVGE